MEQILQTVLAVELLTVQIQRQARVQVGVVPEHLLDVFENVAVIHKDFRIRTEGHFGSFTLTAIRDSIVFCQLSVFKFCSFSFSIAEGLNDKFSGQRIHRFSPDSIQTYGFLKCFAVVLRPSIDFRHNINHLSQWDTTAVITNNDLTVRNFNLDGLSSPHDKFVNGVVQNLFQQDINTIVRGLSITQFSDVHSGTQTDVFIPL